jgi:hypothetical protein
MKVHPVGHSVRFIMSAKIKWPSLRLEARPTGSAMIVPRIKARFWQAKGFVSSHLYLVDQGIRTISTNSVCSFPMTLDNTDAKTP